MNSKRSYRSSRRDPLTPAEAKKTARELFRELDKTPPYLPSIKRSGRVEDIPGSPNPAFLERAAVLADVLLYTDQPAFGEALALILAGRSSFLSRRFGHLVEGAPIPDPYQKAEIIGAVQDLYRRLFPPRRGPCMPNARALRELVEQGHGAGIDTERLIRELNTLLRESCHAWWNNIEHAMGEANTILAASGVERASYELEWDSDRGDERVADFYYVNTGDTYNATLIADNKTHRFRVSTWGDEVEAVEAKHGENGHWRT